MLEEGLSTADGATIARAVRSLARRARRTLARPADEPEARALFEAIEEVERQIEPGTSEDIGRWLANLRRRVEGRLPTLV